MDISVKCFATLDKYQPEDGALEIAQGATVDDVIQTIGAPPDKVTIIFINGKHAQPETVLKEGDKLGLFPAVGGG